MTPEITTHSTPDSTLKPPVSAGMTTKVVKGSLWTLAGQIAPLAFTFVSTPFIIRFLGSEAYGVLLLVGLIPMYFSFADFGMGVASTKFAAEAYGEGDREKEREIVWTATAVAAVSALIVAVPLFLLSYPIVRALNVPEPLLAQASIALKIGSGSFFLGILSGVLNSPMLARLRMDLNSVTQAVPRILLAVVTPFILYFGGGIVEAVGWAFIVAVGMLAVVFYFSGRLLPKVFQPVLNCELVRPLIKFGGAWFVGMVATILLVNLEKLFLTRLVSVKALAYYSVAFTFASTATTFSWAMVQSLIPAFSQIMRPETRGHFDALFSRSLRLTVICLLPVLMALFVMAEPFFTYWAGEEFGAESTLPFYILLIGLTFNVVGYVPYSALLAAGRSEVLAKVYWIELLPYLVLVVALIVIFGLAGAAAAWSIRVAVDSTVLSLLARRIVGVSFDLLIPLHNIVLALVVLLLPVVVVVVYDSFSLSLLFLTPASIVIYLVWAWRTFLAEEEKEWITARLSFTRRL